MRHDPRKPYRPSPTSISQSLAPQKCHVVRIFPNFQCLVVADIVYGVFDNGIIKGYVFFPANPQPLVQDLEHWPPEMADATTAYKLIGDNWYLFVVRH